MKSSTVAAMLILFTLAFSGMPARTSHAADLPSPIGLWKTFDDKTGMPRALVGEGRNDSGGTRFHRHFAAGPIADLAAAKLKFRN
jgi:hypothetical protein